MDDNVPDFVSVVEKKIKSQAKRSKLKLPTAWGSRVDRWPERIDKLAVFSFDIDLAAPAHQASE